MSEGAAAAGAAADGEAQAALAFARAQRDAMLALLERLVRAESPTQQPRVHGPVRAVLREALAEAGLLVRELADRQGCVHLLARPPREQRAGRPLQLVLGHFDTVWPRGTIARMPFAVEGERVRGPGVYDMKAGLVVAVFALRAVRALGLEPAAVPVVFLAGDEERGSPGSGAALRRLARRACRCWVLEPPAGPHGRLKTERKGVGRFVLRVRGRAAHAGLRPEDGVSATLELAHQIVRLAALAEPAAGITINVGTVRGGIAPNVVAPEAEAALDVRVRTGAQARRLERALRALQPVLPGAQIELEGGLVRPPLERTRRNRRLWRQVVRTGRRLGLALGQASVGGASDGNTASLFTATLDGLGPAGGGAHAPEEHVLVPSLIERTALLALLLVLPDLRTRGDRCMRVPSAN